MFRELTRKNKALPAEECIAILKTEKRGILSVNGDDGYPYGMPMNHWYEDSDGCIYFHCGPGGHRLDALQRDGKVSFCVCENGIPDGDSWALKVRSVIVFGQMEVISDIDLVTDISAKLSRKFTDDEGYIQKEIAAFAKKTLLLRLRPEHISGKIVTES